MLNCLAILRYTGHNVFLLTNTNTMTSMSPPIRASPNTMQFDARIFSRAYHWFDVFPRLPTVISFPRFPALSRVCRQRLVDFLRLVNGCCTISGYSDLRCEDSLLILDSRGRTATPLNPLFCSEYLGHVTYSCLTESTSITLICSFLFFLYLTQLQQGNRTRKKV